MFIIKITINVHVLCITQWSPCQIGFQLNLHPLFVISEGLSRLWRNSYRDTIPGLRPAPGHPEGTIIRDMKCDLLIQFQAILQIIKTWLN